MDMKSFLNADTLKAISAATGVDAGDVTKVLIDAMPLLLAGAEKQSKGSDMAGFLQALADHGDKDSSDMAKFVKNIDVEDGAKIVKHLLGAEEAKDAEKAAKATGLDKKTVMKIMAIAAPIIMNQLGKSAKKQAKAKKEAAKKDEGIDMGDIARAVLKNVDAKDVAKIIKALC